MHCHNHHILTPGTYWAPTYPATIVTMGTNTIVTNIIVTKITITITPRDLLGSYLPGHTRVGRTYTSARRYTATAR